MLLANLKTGGRKLAILLMISVAATPMAGCDFVNSFVPKKGESTDVIDRQQGLTVNDFRKLSDMKHLEKGQKDVVPTAALGTPPLPDLAQVLATPKAPKVANSKLVTLSVTEDVPLRDVLFELGRLANVDIEVGNGLDTTGINLRATDRPFNEVIERIAHLGNLRYSVEGNSIRVERDLPYIKNYSLDFLNVVRSSNSTYNLSTNILSTSGDSGGSGGGSGGGSSSGGSGGSGGSGSSQGFGTTGSTNNITSQGESDLFSSLEASITEILNYQPNGQTAATGSGNGQGGGAGGNAPGAGGAVGGGGASGNTNFVVNRQSNVLTVNASQAQHEMIERFLSLLSRNSSAQVLIEAKIVEVSLADQFLSGVNWNSVLGGGKPFAAVGTYQPPAINGFSASAPAVPTTGLNAFSFGIQSGDLDAVIALTQRFGTTRTLSSPRLSAINNQQAVLTFARNEIFFNCTAQQGAVVANTGTTGASVAQPTVSCTQNTVPIGIIMSILPSVNLNTQEVTLNVRPTLTRQVDSVTNPGNILAAKVAGLSDTAAAAINSAVPVIEVRELDSVMKIKSGGVMVIGGLMEDATRNDTTGVPGASEIPIVGNLFKSRSEDSLKRELIIFIKATIVNTDGSASRADKLIYEKYVTDPRPLFKQQ